MKKYLMLILSILCITFSCAFVENQKVYDYAKLLNDDQITDLQSKCIDIATKKSIDTVILTASDIGDKTSKEYANSFYLENGFGYDKDTNTGIILLIDMQNRIARISYFGEAKQYFPTDRIDSMISEITSELKNANYYNGCLKFLEAVDNYMGYLPENNLNNSNNISTNDNNITYNNSNSETISFISKFQSNLPIYLIISLIIGIAGSLSMLYSAGGSKDVGSTTYLGKSSVKINNNFEQYINSTVTTRKISHDDNNNNDINTGGGSSGSSSSSDNGGQGGF